MRTLRCFINSHILRLLLVTLPSWLLGDSGTETGVSRETKTNLPLRRGSASHKPRNSARNSNVCFNTLPKCFELNK